MRYTKEERLNIGREIYEGILTTSGAAEKYKVNFYTARDYLREYKASINKSIPQNIVPKESSKKTKKLLETEYANLTREELIKELAIAKINEARAKKGYEVKGDGQKKEFKPLNKENLK